MISLLLAALPMAAQAPQHPANHLKDETSPYLASHAHNPVNWYPWDEEALTRAKTEDKPIFLSIGYSACHWCHVMERESFENEEIAAILNQNFIAIKVDREERPDLDDLYMTAVQRMTGQGGWPMSVWLTPDLLPFYGGTYFPPESRYGKPGFKDLLTQLAAAWTTRRSEIEEAAKQVDGQLAVDFPALADGLALPEAEILTKREARWVREFARDYDPVDGGFGQAPKFPRADDVRFLLAVAARQPDSAEGADALRMAVHTLKAMASGGMIDRLAGGFARYSVDAKWLIPHFEKMLYDQGTLLPAYLEGWRLSGDEELERIARETADYLLRERQDPGGAFWSATDADSEGVEGKYFVWTPEQLEAALGEEDGRFAAALYGVTAEGNFEHGWSVLTAAKTPREAAAALGMDEHGADARAASVRERLLAARAERIAPLSDDKILLSWNGLAIDALARAGRMLDEPRYTAAAVAAGDFLVATFKQENDRWLRSHRVGRTAHRAVLEDHAYALRGFLELFMGTGDERWLAESESLAAAMLRDFGDEETGLFWDTDGQDPALRHRLKTPWDGATPAPNAVAIEGLLMLHAFTGEERWREPAVRSLLALTELVERQPRSFSATLRLYAWAVQEPAVAVVVGTGSAASLARWRRELAGRDYADALPVLLPAPPVGSERSLFAARPAIDGKPTLYLCVAQVCKLPRTLE